jgi:hypothetical protein
MPRKPKPARSDPPTEPDPSQAPALPYEIATQALQRQLDSAAIVDSKLTNATAGAIGLAALLGAVVALRPTAFKGVTVGCFLLALTASGVVIVLGAVATIPRTWRTGPRAAQVISDFRAGTDETAARWKTVRNLIGSYEINQGALKTKTRLLNGVYGGLAAELLLALIVLVQWPTKSRLTETGCPVLRRGRRWRRRGWLFLLGHEQTVHHDLSGGTIRLDASAGSRDRGMLTSCVLSATRPQRGTSPLA